jgi:hypothetical protein
MRTIALIGIALGLGPSLSPAYVLEGQIWKVGGITINMNINATQYRLTSFRGFPLSDGSPSFQRPYWGVAADWNRYLLRLQIYPHPNWNPAGGTFGNGVNKISFGSTLGGNKLDADTVALTEYYYNPATNTFIEADTVYNENIRWNSYRGPLWWRSMDIRRVMLHETGHMIGLDHPDTAGQRVNAIMNSVVNNTDDLTYDDVTGAQALYGERAAPPLRLPYNPNGVEED